MEAAGCSPPNEAGRQEAGVRQSGRQASRLACTRSLRRCALRFSCAPAPASRSLTHCVSARVRLIKSRALRSASGDPAERSYLRRVLRAAAVSTVAAATAVPAVVRKPAEIRKRGGTASGSGPFGAARRGSTDSLRPVSPVSRKREEK